MKRCIKVILGQDNKEGLFEGWIAPDGTQYKKAEKCTHKELLPFIYEDRNIKYEDRNIKYNGKTVHFLQEALNNGLMYFSYSRNVLSFILPSSVTQLHLLGLLNGLHLENGSSVALYFDDSNSSNSYNTLMNAIESLKKASIEPRKIEILKIIENCAKEERKWYPEINTTVLHNHKNEEQK